MGLLRLPKQLAAGFRLRGRQPTGPVEIDWHNPITRGLRFYLLFGAMGTTDLVSGKTMSSTAADFAYDHLGGSVEMPSHTGTNSVDAPAFDATGWEGVSCVTLCIRSANDFPGAIASVAAGGFSGQWLLGTGTFDQWQWRAGDSTTALVKVGGDVTGDLVFVAGTYDKATKYLYVAPRQEPIAPRAAAGETAAFGGVQAENFIGHYSRSGGRSYTAKIYFAMIYDRALSEGEVHSLRFDPYQVLRPARPAVYFLASVAGEPLDDELIASMHFQRHYEPITMGV